MSSESDSRDLRLLQAPSQHVLYNIQTPINGVAKETAPMRALALRLVRSDLGSISAPARNVRMPLPSIARKLIHSVVS